MQGIWPLSIEYENILDLSDVGVNLLNRHTPLSLLLFVLSGLWECTGLEGLRYTPTHSSLANLRAGSCINTVPNVVPPKLFVQPTSAATLFCTALCDCLALSTTTRSVNWKTFTIRRRCSIAAVSLSALAVFRSSLVISREAEKSAIDGVPLPSLDPRLGDASTTSLPCLFSHVHDTLMIVIL